MDFLKKYWPLFLSLLLAVAIFYPVFGLYFVQDDFFHLKMGQAENLKEFFTFFSFKNPYGYTFYRPLTTQVYTFVVRSFFGLNPFFFHLVSFAFFGANLFLVFKIVERLSQKRSLGFLASFLYAVNASNLGSLAYISAFEEIGMAFFFFLSFWLYLKEKRIALFTFLLALLSRENALIFPLILCLYEFFLGENKLKRTLPFWLILILYGFLRFGSGLPDVSVYRPVFTPIKILNGYFWYFLWGMGLPEMLIDFIGPGFKVSPRFLIWYHTESRIIFSFSLLFLVLLAIGILKSPKKDKKKEAFFILWFLTCLLPVIFWPWHKFSFYLTLPLLGLVGFFTILLKNLPKILLFLGIFALFIVSVVTVRVSWGTYWVINRARIAKNLVLDLKKMYPELPKGATLYFKNDPEYPFIANLWGGSSTQAYYALSGENAAQVLYNDPAIKAYYEDLEKPPEDKIFPIVAKIYQY